MGWPGKKKSARSYYVKLEKQSRDEIIEALKEKNAMIKRGRKPSGLVIKGKSMIPTNILEDLFDLKSVTLDMKCRVGLHEWSDESTEGQKFCKKCFEWRQTELID